MCLGLGGKLTKLCGDPQTRRRPSSRPRMGVESPEQKHTCGPSEAFLYQIQKRAGSVLNGGNAHWDQSGTLRLEYWRQIKNVHSATRPGGFVFFEGGRSPQGAVPRGD